MSNPSKNAGQNTAVKPGNVPFEEALKKLEATVEAMESEELSLESLLAKYEAQEVMRIGMGFVRS